MTRIIVLKGITRLKIYRDEEITSVTLATFRASPIKIPDPFTVRQSLIPCSFTQSFSCTLL